MRPERPFWNPILEILSNPAIPYPAIRLEIESDPIHPMLTAAASSHALKTAPQRSPSGRFRNSKTPWPWRTNESENPIQKLSNVTSETLETEQKTCKKLAAAAATAQRHSHTALPDGETPWPWSPRIPPKNSLTSRLKPRNKTENLQTKQKTWSCCCCYCHCTKTQPHGPAGRGSTMARNDLQKHAAPRLDVPSMRPERPSWNPILEILSNPMLTAAASSHALKTAPQRSPSGRFRNSKTPWPWRTNESENPTQKLSNVTSETLETEQKTCKKLAAAAATAQRHSHTALPDGETPWPWSPRIPPKNSLTSRLKPRNKTDCFWWWWCWCWRLLMLLLLLPCHEPASKMRISELLVPLQNTLLGRGKTAQNHSPRTGKQHGSEGRRRRKKSSSSSRSSSSRSSSTSSSLTRSPLRRPGSADTFWAAKTPDPPAWNTMAVKDEEVVVVEVVVVV